MIFAARDFDAFYRNRLDDAFEEAIRRDPERRRRWVVLVDGNDVQLACIRDAARSVGVTITIVLDLVHVIEYLWRAAYAFHAPGSDGAEQWVDAQLLALLNGRSGGAIARSPRAFIVAAWNRADFK